MKYLSLFLFTLIFSPHSLAWNSANNPANFGTKLERHFTNLPLNGEVNDQTTIWAGYHWPTNNNSINYRWTSGAQNTPSFKPSLEILKGLSASKINGLSPSEKFDIFQGRYDYPTVAKAYGLSRDNASDWNGICHGLAAASLNHSEPLVKTVTNIDGVKLSFFSSDLKALLAFTYATNSNRGVSQIGKRCFFSRNTPVVWRHNSCTDIDAGSFHLILSNFLGIRGEGVLADLDRFKEVWNHPLKSYATKIIESNDLQIKVQTTIVYPEIISPHFYPLIGSNYDFLKSKTYKYILYLNDQGEITGGYWLSKFRPDFMWHQKRLELNSFLDKLLD